MTINPQSIERINPDLQRAPVAPPPALTAKQICTIGAPDACRQTYAQVCEIVTPEARHNSKDHLTYQPVPYASFIDGVRDHVSHVLDLVPTFETYATNKNGQQLFGMIGWESGIAGYGLIAALRISHDDMFGPTVAAGEAPFICANGIINGEHMVKCKHTLNVFERMRSMLGDTFTPDMFAARRQAIEEVIGWKGIPVTDDLFGAYLGILRMRNLITPNAFGAAMAYWRACTGGELHAEHGERDLFGAYQAVTAAGARSRPRTALSHFAGVDHATRAIAEAGGAVDGNVIPQFSLAIREHDAEA